VETPSQGGGRLANPNSNEDAEGEKALISSINQRNKDMADHFGVVK
jgi:ABC-type protease/lipase transport system fused ATPase/permease subunit